MRPHDDPELKIDMGAAQAERIRALRNAIDEVLDALAGGVELGKIDAYNPLEATKVGFKGDREAVEAAYLSRRPGAGADEAHLVHGLSTTLMERVAHLLIARVTPVPKGLVDALYAPCYKMDWRYGSHTAEDKEARRAADKAIFQHHLPESALDSVAKEWGTQRSAREALRKGVVHLPSTEDAARTTPANDRLSRALGWCSAVERVQSTLRAALLQAGAKIDAGERHWRAYIHVNTGKGTDCSLEANTAWNYFPTQIHLSVSQFLRLLREGVWVCPATKTTRPAIRFLDFQITASKTSSRVINGGFSVGWPPLGAYTMPILRPERKGK